MARYGAAVPRELPDINTRLARAAWGYSLLEAKELADLAKIHPRTMQNYLEPNARGPRPDKLWAIARAAGLPQEFMDLGLALLERYAADGSRGPRGQIGQRRTGAGPTLPTRKRRESPGEQDAKRGNEK